MEPNTQPTPPTEDPMVEQLPDAKEPDTGAAISPATPPMEDMTPPVTPDFSGQSMNLNPTPLPSDQTVVTPTTPMPAMAVGGAPAKKNTRMILVIVLIVVIIAAAGLIFYVSTI